MLPGEVSRRDRVRGNHELLDQLCRPVGLVQLKCRQSITGEYRLRLQRLQAERAVVVAQSREPLRDAILKA